MHSKNRPAWRWSAINLAVIALVGGVFVPPAAIAQQAGVPSTPTSLIVNDTRMRAATAPTDTLFDGASLAGWSGDTSVWFVLNGVIHGGNGRSLAKEYYLSSTKTYANFELTAKIKAPAFGNLNNGGIEFLGTSFVDSKGVSRSVIYQFDAGSGYWGTLYDEGSRFRQVRSAPVSPPKDGTDPQVTGYPAWAQTAVKLNDWNDIRIVVEYPRIRGWVNGVLAIDFTETEPEIAKAVRASIAAGNTAPIKLQAHGGSVVQVEYRDIQVTALSKDELLPLGNANFKKVGRWLPPKDIGLIAVNAHLLPNGQVLFHDASQDDNLVSPNGTWAGLGSTPLPSLAAIYVPGTDQLSNLDQWFINQRDVELFCSSHTSLPNGNLVYHGNTNLDKYVAAGMLKASWIYDWKVRGWQRTGDSNRRGYYTTLTNTMTGDVHMMAGGRVGGDATNGRTGDNTEVYNYQAGKWRLLDNDTEWDTLARNYLSGNPLVKIADPYYSTALVPATGRVLHLGGPSHLVAIDPTGKGGALYVGGSDGTQRFWGTSQVYGNGKVLYMGGGAYQADNGPVYRYTNNIPGQWAGAKTQSNSAITIDMNDAWLRAPVVTRTANMQEGRVRVSSSLMADGKVMVNGGHEWVVNPFWKDPAIESGYSWDIVKMRPEIWDPATGVWSEMTPQQRRRQYHGVTVLLPDGRILSGGSGMPEIYKEYGGYTNGITWNDHTIEIFEPPYLFDANGNYATRPAVDWAPPSVGYQQDFSVWMANTTPIRKLHLIKLSSQTHGIEMSSRLVELAYTQNGKQLTVTGLDDSTVAPAGYYMLIAVDDQGVPSVAKMVKVDGYLSVHLVSNATGHAVVRKTSGFFNQQEVGTASFVPGDLGQAWQLHYGKWTGGAYRLLSRLDGSALDASGVTSFQGNPKLNVQAPRVLGLNGTTQTVSVSALGHDALYKLEYAGRSMDAYWQSAANGGGTRNEIVTYPYYGSQNQQWLLYPTTAPVTIRLATSGGALLAGNAALQAEGSSWYFKPSASGGGKVKISTNENHVASYGVSFTTNPNGALQTLLLSSSEYAANTDWEIEYLPKGLMRLKHSKTGKMLSAAVNGALGATRLADRNDSDPYQFWRLTN